MNVVVSRRDGFLLGAFAGALASAVMLVLRILTPTPSIAEFVQDALVSVVPGAVFSWVLDRVGFNAKPLMFALIIVGQIAVGGVLGILYTRISPVRQISIVTAFGDVVLFSVALWALVGFVLLPLTGDGAFGFDRGTDGLPVWMLTFVISVVFTMTLVGLYRIITQPVGSDGQPDIARRQLIGGIGVAAALAAVAGAAGRQLGLTSAARTTSAVPAGLAVVQAEYANISPEVTPNDKFYTVSKNFVDPTVAEAGWKLRISGQVEAPQEWDYQQLRAMPMQKMWSTLACISNDVGGDLMGNAEWTGIPLADLLKMARPAEGVTKTVFYCRDDYTDSIKFDVAMNSGAMLCFEMNGETLTGPHGFPARLIIPGIFGMKNVKWIERIDLINTEFLGFWQKQGWSDGAPYQTTARIDSPIPSKKLPRGTQVTVGGIAFASNRGISQVEVSFDDGASWQPAKIKPPLGKNTWVLLTLPLTVDGDRVLVKVRATDGTGAIQTDETHEPYPNGATGLHAITIRVSDT